MKKLTWKTKLYLFSALIALIPIGIASYNMIGITRDETVSNVNDELITTANELAKEINNIYRQNWVAPIDVLRNGLELNSLGANEKAALLPAVIENTSDIISFILYFEVGKDQYVKAVQAQQKRFAALIADKGIKESGFFELTSAEIKNINTSKNSFGEPTFFKQIDQWQLTIVVPVKINGAPPAFLATKVDLNRVRDRIINHPFTKNGKLFLLNNSGEMVFSAEKQTFSDKKVIGEIKKLLESGSRIGKKDSYTNEKGESNVVCYAFPDNLDWAVLAEINEDQAYVAVSKMEQSLFLWVLLGVVLAGAGVFFFSRQISTPISVLTGAASEISKGNFDVKVNYTPKDEIGFLGKTLESMSNSLKESFARIERQNQELEEYNRTLEDKVALRTKELEQKNIELQDLLEKLKATQTQLISHEKLASLGALTAGIAHEIQNPLNFVNNFSKISVSLVDELNEEIENALKETENEGREILEEICEDLKVNVAKINEHGRRAESIVKNMLQHSRGDSGQLMKSNIPEMIDEAISLSYHSLKTKDKEFQLSIKKDFDTGIKELVVNPQALSRVIINIVNNGLYAIQEKIKKNPEVTPVIEADLKDRGDRIEIRIKDNGTGMPEKVVQKIFEPFYTTKPTGEGTGLGLSLSYDIVTKMHKGELIVNTKDGEFTEFRILIPKDLSST